MSTAAPISPTILDMVDRRVLAAFVCVDAITGNTIVPALQVSAPSWVVKPNRSGIYVIFNGPNFSTLTTQFVPTGTWPPPANCLVTLQDPNGRYLPRRAVVQAPVSVPAIPPAPAGVAPNPAVVAAQANPATIFDPQQVVVFPSPSGAIGPNWSTIHASVTQGATSAGLPWAVLQVVRQSDGKVLAKGQTNVNGEALLAVVGLTVHPSSTLTGSVNVSSVPVTITAYFDKTVVNELPGWIPNPDDILLHLPGSATPNANLAPPSSQTVNLSAGQEISLTFAITF